MRGNMLANSLHLKPPKPNNETFEKILQGLLTSPSLLNFKICLWIPNLLAPNLLNY